jgi:hypothetical protein
MQGEYVQDLISKLVVKILSNVQDAFPLKASPDVQKLPHAMRVRSWHKTHRAAHSSIWIGVWHAIRRHLRTSIREKTKANLVSLFTGSLVRHTRDISSSHAQCAQCGAPAPRTRHAGSRQGRRNNPCVIKQEQVCKGVHY